MTGLSILHEEPPAAEPAPAGHPPPDQLEACLLFLCAHFGIPATASSIRARLAGGNAAMTLRQMLEVARPLGLVAQPAAHKLGDLDAAEFPLLLLLKDGRVYVALERPEAG